MEKQNAGMSRMKQHFYDEKKSMLICLAREKLGIFCVSVYFSSNLLSAIASDD